MAAANIAREEAVARLFPVFRDRGYAGASLAELAKASGLGKSSLYHYFPGGKEDMALAVIHYADAWLHEHVMGALRGAGTPRARLGRVLSALDRLYAGGTNACLLGALVLGGARDLFARQLHAAFSQWVDALAGLLEESGIPRIEARERAQDAVARIEGALILAGGLDDPAPFRRVLRRLPKDLLGP
jgi:TetR/AcrR family transcriptional repressor of lmrAB and yxaGH operons